MHWTIKFVSASFQVQMMYPAAFFMKFLALALSYAATTYITWMFLRRFPTLGGWSFSDIVLMYGIGIFSYGVASLLFWEMRNVGNYIRNGSMDSVLIRPTHPVLYLSARRIETTSLGHSLIGLGLIVWIVLQNESMLNYHILMSLVSILVTGIAIQSAIHVMSGATAFWLLSNKSVWSIQADIRELSWYPISIFPGVLQGLLASVYPLAFVNFIPVIRILNKQVPNIYPSWLWILTPVVTIVLWAGALLAWQSGLRKYEGGRS